MRRAALVLFFSLALQLCVRPCFAASFDYREIDDGIYLIDLVGEIRDGDSKKLLSLIAAQPTKFLGTSNLSLHSPGGSVFEAIKISDAIRESGLGIVVEREQTCASSCFLIWASADFKSSFSNSHIIIHRPFIPTDAVNLENYGKATVVTGQMLSAMRDYLTQQNVPSLLIDKMMRLPSSEGYELSLDDLQELGFMTPVLEEKAINVCHVSNNTILYSGDVRESTLCVDGILKELRLQYLAKLIGHQPAMKAMQERLVQISVRENQAKLAAGQNLDPVPHASMMYLGCSLRAYDKINQPTLSDDQVVNASLVTCEKYRSALLDVVVKDLDDSVGPSPESVNVARDYVEKVRQRIRDQIIQERHK